MIGRLRGLSIPFIDPALRPFRFRIARLTILGLAVLLVIWVVAEGAMLLLYPAGTVSTETIYIHLASMLLLAAVIAVAARKTRRGEIPAAGYYLAAGISVIVLLAVILQPLNIYLVSAFLLAPILISGAIIGGRAPFLFAALAAGTTAFGLWRVNASSPDFFNQGPFFNGFVFLTTQVIIQFSVAGLLHVLSNEAEQTITRLRIQTDQMTQLANTDPLTGLANRRFLISQLEREFARARRYDRPLSLLYIDLDGFKSINDRCGHLVGDEILRSIAMTMQAVLRSTDLLARIGGDEFAVLLPETNIKGANGVVLKLRKAITSLSQSMGESKPDLTFCAGIAQMRKDDKNIDDILGRADQAQYNAKAAGRSQIRSQHDASQLPLFQAENPEGLTPER